MKAYLETPHLILRNFKESDAASMFETYCHSEKVTRYLTWYPHSSIRDTQIFLKNIALASIDESNSLELALALKEKPDDVIGSIGVVNQFEDYIAEVGYAIGEAYWNHGYMSEAFKALITYLFETTPIQKVRALHDCRNVASGRVMVKCGLKKSGICLHQRKFDLDEQVECVVYELTKEEYLRQKH